MKPPTPSPNPTAASQIGTILVGSVAGLAVCAIVTQIVSSLLPNKQSVPVTG